MSKTSEHAELPAWVLPVVIAVAIVVLVFVGYRAFTTNSSDIGPRKEVHAGMYDYRQAVQQRNAGNNH